MSAAEKATAAIAYEISRMPFSITPTPDNTFVRGMIELAEMSELVDRVAANRYRAALDTKYQARLNHLKGVAA
ncbi:hypothetical protein [Pseudomonas sp. CCC4.4]|uniref:hypothetical protein n=1 Tax=Pseudomonas sp. CCC4.4 TaxID=3048612 RepID=UPI002B234D73|nr:hypothetical protein [Pseudomonas sp. CCC4.4]MEB0170056.1 hypothetical protein [Pseudomonas sp. CCC4.4]